nr:hypothetical protein [uncultured bacterium]
MVSHHTASPGRYQCLAQAIQPDQTSSRIEHATTRPRNLIRETKKQWTNLGGWTVGQWESPNAQAYYYLCDLDLTGEGQGPGPLLGDLQFRMGEVSCGDYLGVLSEDPITASLLQARLIELGHSTPVEIVDRS